MTLFETYNDKIEDIREEIVAYFDDGEEKFREERNLSKDEYAFKKVNKIPLVHEHYNSSQLKRILEEVPEHRITKSNSLAKKFNDVLKNEEDNIYFLDTLVNKLYSTLNPKGSQNSF